MRILQVVEPGKDGVFRHVEDLTGFLIGKGHEVSLAYSSIRGSDRLWRLVDRVERSGGATCDLCVGNRPSLADLRAFYRLYALLQQVNPEIIHSHSSKAGALARILSVGGLRVQQFYTPNAYYGMGRGGGWVTSAYDLVESALGRLATTINVSRGEADFAEENLHLPKGGRIVIPNSIDCGHLRPIAPIEREKLRRDFGIPEGAVVLGTVGRFSKQKDFDTFYRSVMPVMRDEPQLWVVHLGEGVMNPDISTACERHGLLERIIRLPYRPEPRAVYGTFDGFMNSSRYEGLSYAVLEALALGIPLILSDVVGNADIAALDLSHCWTAVAGDVAGFERAIRSWLADGRRSRRSNHRELAEQHFEIGKCCARVFVEYVSSLNCAVL